MEEEKGRREKTLKKFSYQSVRVGTSQTTLANEISIFTKWGGKEGEMDGIKGVNYMS